MTLTVRRTTCSDRRERYADGFKSRMATTSRWDQHLQHRAPIRRYTASGIDEDGDKYCSYKYRGGIV
jgi:hypothetical protein